MPSNFIGVNAIVSGNTLTTTSGFSSGTPNNGFTGGAYSALGYSALTLSAPNVGIASSAMLIGLNLVSSASSVANVVGSASPPISTYQLYFHGDSSLYLALVDGVQVATAPGVAGDGTIGSLVYTGTQVTWMSNNVPLFTLSVPSDQSYLPLYPTWTSFYLGATSTLTVTPQPFSVDSAAPYAALITSEHNQKPNFMALVSALCAAAGDTTAAIESLVPAFSLDGAIGAQQDILGIWIGQSRVIPGILVPGFFGFSELSSGLPDGLQSPFGELSDPSIGGIFFDLGGTAAGTTTLTDSQYLTILKARIARNQSNGTIGAIEGALAFIFGGAGGRVIDNANKTIALQVTSPITPVDQSLLTGLDILAASGRGVDQQHHIYGMRH